LISELNQLLVEHDAELPYLNPKFKNAKLPSAKIMTSTFSHSEAKVSIDPNGAKVAKSYVLYYGDTGSHATEDKSIDYRKVDKSKLYYQVKRPTTISSNGLEITAGIPNEVNRVRFIIIDENNYCQFTNIIDKK